MGYGHTMQAQCSRGHTMQAQCLAQTIEPMQIRPSHHGVHVMPFLGAWVQSPDHTTYFFIFKLIFGCMARSIYARTIPEQHTTTRTPNALELWGTAIMVALFLVTICLIHLIAPARDHTIALGTIWKARFTWYYRGHYGHDHGYYRGHDHGYGRGRGDDCAGHRGRVHLYLETPN